MDRRLTSEGIIGGITKVVMKGVCFTDRDGRVNFTSYKAHTTTSNSEVIQVFRSLSLSLSLLVDYKLKFDIFFSIARAALTFAILILYQSIASSYSDIPLC